MIYIWLELKSLKEPKVNKPKDKYFCTHILLSFLFSPLNFLFEGEEKRERPRISSYKSYIQHYFFGKNAFDG